MEKEMEYLKIGEALIGEEQIMEMAKYINHLEQTNAKLMSELEQSKSYLSATLQQRNSAEQKLRNVLEMRMNTVPLTTEVIKTEIVSAIDLMNPEQYREKKNQR